MVLSVQGLIVFDVDKEKWTLDLRPGKGSVTKGPPAKEEKPDLTLTISDDNFLKLTSGKLGPQQVGLSCANLGRLSHHDDVWHTSPRMHSVQAVLIRAAAYACDWCRRSS